MAYVTAPDGSLGVVPDDQLQEAVKQGYRPRNPTPAEAARAEAEKHPIQAFTESAIGKGLGMGFLTPVVRNVESGFTGKSKEQVASEMAAREKANPVADVAGQLAGGTALAAMTGGAGELMGAKTALQRVGAAAVEGTLNGLGSEVTEATLQNRSVQAEKLALAGGIGLVAGAGLAGTFEGLRAGASAAVRSTGAKSFAERLQEQALDAEFNALASHATPGQRAENAQFKEPIVKLAREHGVLGFGGKATDESIAPLRSSLEKEGQKIGEQVSLIDEKFPLQAGAGTTAEDAAARRDALALAFKRRIDEKFGKNPAYKDAVKEFTGQIDDFVGTPQSWGDVWKWQAKLWGSIEAGGASNRKDVMRELRNAIRDEAMTAAERLNPGQEAMMRASAARHRGLGELVDMLERKAEKVGNKSVLAGAGEGALYGLLAGHPLEGAAVGAGKTALTNFAEGRGSFIGAAALRTLADGPVMGGMAKGLANRVSQVLTVAPAALGSAGAALERALARGNDALLAEHARLASGPGGDKYLATLGYTPETPDQMRDVSTRMAVYGSIESNTRAVDASIDRAVDGFFGAKPGPKSAKFSSMSEKDYRKLTETISATLKNPESAFGSVPPEYMASAPGTFGEAVASHLKALQFLQAKAPKDPNASVPAALRAPWSPSPADLDRWNRYVEAVTAPQKVLEQMGKGVMTKEYIEGLQVAYPQVYEEMRQKMTMRLMEWKKPLPYEKRLGLAYVLGPQALNMTPMQIGVIQSGFQKQTAGNPQQGGGKSPDGRQQPNVQKNLETQAQRLEAR